MQIWVDQDIYINKLYSDIYKTAAKEENTVAISNSSRFSGGFKTATYKGVAI